MKELILSLENGEINLDQFVELMAATSHRFPRHSVPGDGVGKKPQVPKQMSLTADAIICRGECAL